MQSTLHGTGSWATYLTTGTASQVSRADGGVWQALLCERLPCIQGYIIRVINFRTFNYKRNLFNNEKRPNYGTLQTPHRDIPVHSHHGVEGHYITSVVTDWSIVMSSPLIIQWKMAMQGILKTSIPSAMTFFTLSLFSPPRSTVCPTNLLPALPSDPPPLR